MAAKFFTGLPLDGPDPECVFGHGETALPAAPGPSRRVDHSNMRRRARGACNETRPDPVSMAGTGLVRVGRRSRSGGRNGRCPLGLQGALAGAERGKTLHDNLAAFAELGFAPRVAGPPPARDSRRR